MNGQVDIMFILQLGTGLFWIVTYILMIKRGIEDRTYGMPMAALCANISWEFIFSFIYPHEGLQSMINIIWFSLDVVIVLQCLVFGWKDFKRYMSVKYFYPAFLLTLVLSFLITIAVTLEFNDFQGKYAAFAQNLMMSILFISFLLKRGNLAGQSLSIAFFKMMGSLCAAVGLYLYDPSILIIVLSLATLVFDLLYMLFAYKVLRKCRVNTWCWRAEA